MFEQNGNAIGDFNMIDATHGLIIERDNGEGTKDKACAEGQRGTDCFPDLAKFKRVYKIELTDANVGQPVRKVGYIDLMKIRDPNKKAKKPLNDGALDLPVLHHRERRQGRRRPTSSSATTTTCRSPRAASPTRPTTTSSCCWKSRIS